MMNFQTHQTRQKLPPLGAKLASTFIVKNIAFACFFVRKKSCVRIYQKFGNAENPGQVSASLISGRAEQKCRSLDRHELL